MSFRVLPFFGGTSSKGPKDSFGESLRENLDFLLSFIIVISRSRQSAGGQVARNDNIKIFFQVSLIFILR